MKKQGRNNKAGLRKLERKREVGEREREGEKIWLTWNQTLEIHVICSLYIKKNFKTKFMK